MMYTEQACSAVNPTKPRISPEWYEPHIRAWSEHASPETTLWFWNTEEGRPR